MTAQGSHGSCRKRELVRLRPCSVRVLAYLLVAGLAPYLFAGCASPGEPYERKPPEPAAVADLAALQSGNSVALSFTLPKETVDHRDLSRPLSVQIYRRFGPARSVSPTPAGPVNVPFGESSLRVTIPPAVLTQYSDRGRIRYVDQFEAAAFPAADPQVAQYIVRTSVSGKKPSSDSNLVTLVVYPAPLPIADLKAEVTHSGIVLVWTPPRTTLVGSVASISGYAIYRAEVEPGAAAQNSENPKFAAPLAKIGASDSATYQDGQTEVDKAYAYSVRSIVQEPSEMLESSDSNLAVIVARDIFPPAALQGLVVAPVPAQGGMPGYMDLSWSVSPETDTAGYNVYRSEQAGVPGNRLNIQLLPAPAFRDMTTVPSRVYFYSVTATDRSGNESPASEAVSGVVPLTP